MKRKLVFATNNAHKLEEVSSILADKVELLSLDDINCHTDIGVFLWMKVCYFLVSNFSNSASGIGLEK